MLKQMFLLVEHNKEIVESNFPLTEQIGEFEAKDLPINAH